MSVLAIALCTLVSSACVGLDADVSYPDFSRAEVRGNLVTPENASDPWMFMQSFRVKDDVCAGIDTSPATRPLSHDDFVRFLGAQGRGPTEVKARGNLFWFDFPGADPDDGDVVRLRLAVLADAKEAANELHGALLEHGPGWWGLRRGNLSVLAPKAGLAEAMSFAIDRKLVCWGMFEMAGVDDVYVFPGPYMEL
ncbi:MAG: hypothetical protein EXR75_11315 [Myxococcales bacterium]|nr:hypothetical protein [Myxococcales bacterium]